MSYADFRNGLQSFNEYVSTENQSLNLAGDYDNAVVRVELGQSPKQLICDILAGKWPPLPQIQFCLDVNLSIVQGLAAGVHIGLASALGACREGLQAFNEHTSLSSTLARLNMIIGEAAAVASMINICNSPINPVPIPNLIETIMGSFLGKGEAILNKLGRLVPGRLNVCYDPVTGKIGHDAYASVALLDEIRQALEAGFDITGIVDEWMAQLYSIRDDFAYIISLENNAASAAVEAQGLGKTVDTVTALADNTPRISISSVIANSTHAPKRTVKSNKYKNTDGSTVTGTVPNGTLEETTNTIEIALKFTEKMNPSTITGRLDTDTTPLNTGRYGTMAVVVDNNELVCSIGPIRTDENYTTFKAIFVVPTSSVPTSGTKDAQLKIGSNGRDDNGGVNLVVPKTETDKEMLPGDEQTIDFKIAPAEDATAATDVVRMGVPGDMILGIPEFTSVNEPMTDVVDLFAIFKQLSGYPVQTTDGSVKSNVFKALLDDSTIATLASGENYIAPVYTSVPEYDYCGNIIGYKTEFTQGALAGDTPTTVAAMATNLLIPPTIVNTSPSTGVTGVFIDTTITITFSQEMDPSTFTTGDVRTTWKPSKTYSNGDIVEYLGTKYKSTANNNVRNPPPGSASWTQLSAAQTGAGTGTVRFKKGTEYLTGFTISYNAGSKQLVISPASNLVAGTQYHVQIIGSSSAVPDETSPVENMSGVPMSATFGFSFTTSSSGETQSSGVVVSAAGGTVGLPSYTKTQLAALAVTGADAGSMAWCSDANGGASTAVYNGTKWVKVSDGTDV